MFGIKNPEIKFSKPEYDIEQIRKGESKDNKKPDISKSPYFLLKDPGDPLSLEEQRYLMRRKADAQAAYGKAQINMQSDEKK